MSKKLNSIILPSVLEGDSEPPCKQSNLSESEMKSKEAKVLDNAMELVTRKYWDGAMFNNSEVHSRFRPSMPDEGQFQEYKEVHKIVTGSKNTLRSSLVATELRFMLKHIERKSHEITFRKCFLASCDHSSSNPIVSVNAWEYMKDSAAHL